MLNAPAKKARAPIEFARPVLLARRVRGKACSIGESKLGRNDALKTLRRQRSQVMVANAFWNDRKKWRVEVCRERNG